MTFGEIKDLVRDHIGRTDIPPHQMKYFMDSARRLIEKEQHWYWMEAQDTWSTVVGQAEYAITVTAGGGLNLPAYKDVKTLYEKTTTSSLWTEVEITDFQQARPQWSVDDTGEPEKAVFQNLSIFLFPPLPDAIYDMMMDYWQWTDNPASNNLTDELCTRFPELLIYAATMFGTKFLTKNPEEYGPWQTQFAEELKRVARFDNDRHGAERINFTPRRGPFIVR